MRQRCRNAIGLFLRFGFGCRLPDLLTICLIQFVKHLETCTLKVQKVALCC